MLTRPIIEAAVTTALREDLTYGDLTTEAVVSPTRRGRARILAREPLTLCGAEVAAHAFWAVDPDLAIELGGADGDAIVPPRQVMLISGAVRSILVAERGGAQLPPAPVGRRHGSPPRSAPPSPAPVPPCATPARRLPGLRALEKHAVRAGGGRSHRSTLADCALIKDNHIAAAGGVGAAVERVRARTPHVARVEVEVETPEQLAEALDAGADVILLDNMPPAEVRAAVETIGGRAITEASGSIHLDNVRAYAEAGVDMISTSALTSTVPAGRPEPGAGSRLMRTVRTDCLVIGCGLAGAGYAYQAAKAGLHCILLSGEPSADECNSARAQGGIVDPAVDPDSLRSDIMTASAEAANPRAVDFIVERGGAAVRELVDELDVPFERDGRGELRMTREAAHSEARILFAKDQTGRAIVTALHRAVAASPRIELAPHTVAVDLLTLSHSSGRPAAPVRAADLLRRLRAGRGHRRGVRDRRPQDGAGDRRPRPDLPALHQLSERLRPRRGDGLPRGRAA